MYPTKTALGMRFVGSSVILPKTRAAFTKRHVSNALTRRFPHPLRTPSARTIVLASIPLYLLIPTGETAAVEHLHSLSPVYHATIIHSEADSWYTFHSAGVSYATEVRLGIGFRGKATALFPIHLFQDGSYFAARELYRPAVGAEAQLGVGYTFRLPDDQLLIVDVGFAANFIKLGSDTLESFYNFTAGPGAGAEFLYPVNRLMAIGAFLNLSVHLLDFAHESDGLRYGLFASSGITLGLRFLDDGGASP